jgi:hypothetical protein
LIRSGGDILDGCRVALYEDGHAIAHGQRVGLALAGKSKFASHRRLYNGVPDLHFIVTAGRLHNNTVVDPWLN